MVLLCPVVPCQHGLVRRAGEAISHTQQRRHDMTAHSLKLSSLNLKYYAACK